MTFAQAVFWGCAAMAVVPAAGLLIARSIVRMAFLLLGSLAGFAGIYLLLGAGFVGFAQILVYIGGILVLFLFGVMLTSREGVAARRRLPAAAVAPAVSAGLLVLAGAVYLALAAPWAPAESALGPGAGPPPARTEDLGAKLLGAYAFPFEAVSVLLLAAMVGATYLARREADGGRDSGGEPR